MAITRAVKTELGFALLLIFLGAGNIVFGSWKTEEYQHLLSKANESIASPTSPDPLASEEVAIPAPPASLPSESDSEYPAQLKARFDFYLFVIVGGKWILALAGFFLLLALMGMREGEKNDGPTNPIIK